MEVIVLKSGFQQITANNLRLSAETKGKNLYESGHVKNVEERQFIDKSVIRAQVIRQTNIKCHFNVTINVDLQRNLLHSNCECPAGSSQQCCKHTAAVIIFVNNETANCKTSRRCEWNIPSVSSLAEEYKKGSKICELIRPKTYNKPLEPVVLPCLNFSCPLADILYAMSVTETTQIINGILNELVNVVVEIACSAISLCIYNQIITQHSSTNIYSTNNNFRNENHETFYQNNVKRNINELANICSKTYNQAECEIWHTERITRITSSTAHQVKTRRSKFEELASKMLNPKQMKRLQNLDYGLNNENAARTMYKNATGYQVEECGLVIHPYQEWLCASPDGIIIVDGKIVKTLEIKCPITLRDSPLVDNDGKIKLGYLRFNENNNLILKETHCYYTQIQLQMYCTGLKKCDFFIYSPNQDCLLIEIARDEDFLLTYIPKLENFYINVYLEKLFHEFGLNK